MERRFAMLGASLTICGMVICGAGMIAFNSGGGSGAALVATVHHIAGWTFLLFGGSAVVMGITLMASSGPGTDRSSLLQSAHEAE
jgi:hypothetical protein